jgi:hypothetical protein
MVLQWVHQFLFSLPIIGPFLLRKLGESVMEITIEGWAGTRRPQITLSEELERA